VRHLVVLCVAAALPAFAEEQPDPVGIDPEFVRALVPVGRGRNDSNPVWSLAGDTVAFERSRGDDKEIVVVRASGEVVQTLHQQSPPVPGQSRRATTPASPGRPTASASCS
jgi:hypothetical protein